VGSSENIVIRGAFSYPFGSEDQGGYVLYRYTVPFDSEGLMTYAEFNYMHDATPFHIPYVRAEDRIMTYSFYDNLQQHVTTYKSPEFKE